MLGVKKLGENVPWSQNSVFSQLITKPPSQLLKNETIWLMKPYSFDMQKTCNNFVYHEAKLHGITANWYQEVLGQLWFRRSDQTRCRQRKIININLSSDDSSDESPRINDNNNVTHDDQLNDLQSVHAIKKFNVVEIADAESTNSADDTKPTTVINKRPSNLICDKSYCNAMYSCNYKPYTDNDCCQSLVDQRAEESLLNLANNSPGMFR